MKKLFEEKQKFTQWWLWLILTIILLIPSFGIYKQFVLNEELGDHPSSNLGMVLFLISIAVLIAFFLLIQLKTEVTEAEIRVRFFPLVTKRIKWSDIKSAKMVNYGFIGGWGIRLWTEYGTVYNIKGNIGVALELNNGKKYLIGTQKEMEFNRVLDTADAQNWKLQMPN